MAQSFQIQTQRGVIGPVSASELQQMASDGQLSPDTAVSGDGINWLRAGRVHGLRFGRGRHRNASAVSRPSPPPIPSAGHVQLARNVETAGHGAAPQSALAAQHSSRVMVAVGALAGSILFAGVLVALSNLRSNGDSSPAPVAAPAAKPETARERMGRKTLAVWNRINRLELSIRPVANKDPLEALRQAHAVYCELPVEDIDPELRDNVYNRIKTMQEYDEVLTKWTQGEQAIRQDVERAAQFGAAIGSSDQHNPQGGRIVGEIFARGLSGAAVENRSNQLYAKLQPEMDRLSKASVELTNRRAALGSILGKRYGLEFNTIK